MHFGTEYQRVKGEGYLVVCGVMSLFYLIRHDEYVCTRYMYVSCCDKHILFVFHCLFYHTLSV